MIEMIPVTSVIMYTTAVVCAVVILLKGLRSRSGGRLFALAIFLEISLLAIATYLYTPGTEYSPVLDIIRTPLLVIVPLIYWLAISRITDTTHRGKIFIPVVLSAATVMTIVYAIASLSDIDTTRILYMTTRGDIPPEASYPASYYIIMRLDMLNYYLEMCVTLTTQVYILASFMSYRRAILDTFSDPESKSLPEMTFLIVTLIAKTIMIIAISTPVVNLIWEWIIPFRDITTALFFVAQTVILCRMKYSAVELRELYAAKKEEEPEEENVEKEKTTGSPYTALIAERLGRLIEDGFYRQKDINVIDLSLKIGVNREYLSKHIRTQYGETFSSFVGRLRVEDAKALLSEPGASVAEVSDKVGFGNVSTFYRHFKAVAGCSPKDWWQRAHSDEF